jgi:hypothetical protein
MRLGKIERALLTYPFRLFDPQGFVPKSGALFYYARHLLGYSASPWARSVKSVVSLRDYRGLHASFSRALDRLADDELLIRARRKDVLAPENYSSSSGTHHRGARRDSFYALTVRGRRLARLLLLNEAK